MEQVHVQFEPRLGASILSWCIVPVDKLASLCQALWRIYQLKKQMPGSPKGKGSQVDSSFIDLASSPGPLKIEMEKRGPGTHCLRMC